MPLQSSGPISLNDIHLELGGTTGTTVSMNDTDVRALISSTSGSSVSFSDYYGASAAYSNGHGFYGNGYPDIYFDNHEWRAGYSTNQYINLNLRINNFGGTSGAWKDAVICNDFTSYSTGGQSAVIYKDGDIYRPYVVTGPDSNNVYVVGATEGTSTTTTCSLHGFDKFTRQWVLNITSYGLKAISTDLRASGYVYVLGQNGNNFFITKVSTSDGSVSWTRVIASNLAVNQGNSTISEYDSTKIVVSSNTSSAVFLKSDGTTSSTGTLYNNISHSSLSFSSPAYYSMYSHPSGASGATFSIYDDDNKATRYYIVLKNANGSYAQRYYTTNGSYRAYIRPLGRDSFAILMGTNNQNVYPRFFTISSSGAWTDWGSVGIRSYQSGSYSQPLLTLIPQYYAENDYFSGGVARYNYSTNAATFAFGEQDINNNTSLTSYTYNIYIGTKTSETWTTWLSTGSYSSDSGISYSLGSMTFNNVSTTLSTNSSATSNSTASTNGSSLFTISNELTLWGV